MPLSFEMPRHLANSAKSAPIYQLVHPIFMNQAPNPYPYKNPKPYLNILSEGYTNPNFNTKLDPQPFRDTKQYWQQRLEELQGAFQVTGEVEQLDVADRLVARNERQHLHVYKASHSFIYFDRALVSSTDPADAEKLLSVPAAAKRAKVQLGDLKLLDEYSHFRGIGYTGVTVDQAEPPYPDAPAAAEYRTEIKVHYGFKVGGLPVFGPGAKIVVSYVGEELSQLTYFWRTPRLVNDDHFASSKVARGRPLISPREALEHFCHDNRFTKLKKGHAKVRFHDLQLGYYAASPQEVQRFLYPVYQVKGTVETWQTSKNGFNGTQEHVSSEVFRYDFTLYMLAVSDPNLGEKKIYSTREKEVTIF